MTALDPTGPAPETRRPRFVWLLLAACAAPLAWLGQMMLNYGLTAQACYPGDHPVPASGGALLVLVWACNIAALAICGGGAAVAWRYRGRVKNGRDRFLALWGLMSSLWFFAAILFNVIATAVPPCAS